MLERNIVSNIRDYLEGRGCYVLKNHADGYSPPGISDLFVFAPGGRFMAIEVKQPKGVVSPQQARFIRRLKENGFNAFVARSVEDVINNYDN